MDVTMMPGYVPGFRLELGIRELGGWKAADGRTVRHGLLYRGSALVGLLEEERRTLDSLELQFVLDLRATGELEGQKDLVPNGTEYRRVSGMYDVHGDEVDFSPKGMERLAQSFTDNPEDFLKNLYVSMMFGNPAVHLLVDKLVAGKAPLFFHCTAGKDRTGVCAAVTLMLLGVPDDDIMCDYLLTNEYRASIINMRPEDLPPDVTPDARENWARYNSVDPAQLQAALDAVDERYPTREAYFEDEFGLDAPALAALRNTYLV